MEWIDMTTEQLAEVLRLHSLWLSGKTDGIRADLSRANLSRADLSGADLSRADLSEANLSRADLSGADLSGADLIRANLSGAYLSGANLSGANLREAYLRGAYLRENLKAGRYVGCASRGDQYTFYAFETDAGELFYLAGCRAMLRSEYEAHIEREYPATPKAAKTRACLDYLASLVADEVPA
jgi:uncharacterized protein YjbI with pentapeptide repeats